MNIRQFKFYLQPINVRYHSSLMNTQIRFIKKLSRPPVQLADMTGVYWCQFMLMDG